MSDPKQLWIKTRVILVARVLVAATVALSFLITVAPLGTASSAETATMDCCVGKRGHVPGSCATGLLASAKRSQSESPASDDDPASPSEFSLAIVAGVSAGEHCGLQAQAAAAPASTRMLIAEPREMLATAEIESGPLTVEAIALPTAEFGLTSLRTVSKPCMENCSACSTSITRRPREQATPSFAARPHIPSVRRFSSSDDLQIRPLNRKWLHLRPRAPPA